MQSIIIKTKKYCNSLTKYSRYKTREVYIGNIPLGSSNPIRIQSMTTTDTMDTAATVEQTIRMVNAGCEYVRITAPSKLEAENLSEIKKELQKKGCSVPLIADIHFTPNAAEIAARIVEKVRINPGNYADKKNFQTIDYSNDVYNAELERIRKKFTPLIKICKEYGTAMRIGTNHGSLSDRIMSRYGDTPLGMVESALEFVRICEDLNYYQIVLSMKASNTQVMIQAYRLLINRMEEEGMNYPLHLGVTEAGGGEDGRIKSALGIGTLLEDGLGDTIRVSLTEDPEYEAPVAIALVNRYKNRADHQVINPIDEPPIDPFNYIKHRTINVNGIGGTNLPLVVADYGKRNITDYKHLEDIGYFYDKDSDKWSITDTAADIIYLGNTAPLFNLPAGLKVIFNYEYWIMHGNREKEFPLIKAEDFLTVKDKSPILNFVSANIHTFSNPLIEKIKNDSTVVLILESDNRHGMAEQRRVYFTLLQYMVKNPVIIKRSYNDINIDNLMLFAPTDFGSLLVDGFGDGVWLELNYKHEVKELNKTLGNDVLTSNFIKKKESPWQIVNRLLFGILQAARVRISKTEYIACPSCGRTLFDLQLTTELIRKKTEHLKGVKIAIMGCIVNGPGEMADADYGYVGSGVDKITLYRGKNIVRRNISAGEAVEALINLIKEDNLWLPPL